MKNYTGKTVEEALKIASEETGITIEELIYIVGEEKKGLFGKTKSVDVDVYDLSEVLDYIDHYIVTILENAGIEASTNVAIKDNDIIKVTIMSNHNPVIIGKGGATLQALNEIVKTAVSAKFKRRFRVLLDVGDYKSKKYRKIIFIAKKEAKRVVTTHIPVALDPMTADERKQIHNALAKMKHISTESEGDGKERHIVIKYKDIE